jgi:mRNA-degrading endonuclease RelE of RelBE toxin-antitoxin system
MNFILTSPFKRAYRSLPDEAKICTKDALRTLAGNIKHPSLHMKKIKGTKNIWETRVSLDYRLTFQVVKDY